MRAKSSRAIILTSVAATLLVLCLAALCGCGQAKVDDSSPRVTDVGLSAQSDGNEQSQHIDIVLTFDQQISASRDVMGDFEFTLNGAAVDESAISVEARPSARSVTVSLRPASGAQGPGAGVYFATYQSEFALAAKDGGGALPSITGASGAAAVLEQPVTGVLPSGVAIEMVDSQEGSATGNQVAQATFRVTSPAQARAITWFSPDGGKTKLLKHNHTFYNASTQDVAADLVKVVNADSTLGIRASAKGNTVTLKAVEVVDGQKIEPCIVEGVGAVAGTYDESMAPEGGA